MYNTWQLFKLAPLHRLCECEEQNKWSPVSVPAELVFEGWTLSQSCWLQCGYFQSENKCPSLSLPLCCSAGLWEHRLKTVSSPF